MSDSHNRGATGRHAVSVLLSAVRNKWNLLGSALLECTNGPTTGWMSRSWFRYGLATAFTALASLLRWALPGVLKATPYLAFYPAVVAAAAFCGPGPGLLATVGSLLCVDLMFDDTPGYIDLDDPIVLARTAIFLAGGIGVSVIAGMQRWAQSRQRRQADDLAAAKTSAERAKAAAEQANRTKDHFLAVLSHELRTPLTPVVMGVSMLQDRTDLDAGARESLEMIRRNVEMEALLIDDLLDVTRIAHGKIELNRRPVELHTVIWRAVEVCRPDIEARRLQFGVDLGPAASYWVEADAARLQQVFWNLLRNAIKFTPRDGCVGIRCRPDNEHVLVEVNDSGIGIEPEALSRIFNTFEQAERSITRQFGGLGLGLAISKALVEMHGGRIDAHSEGRDKGTTICVRLPLTTPTRQTEVSASTLPPKATVRPLRVLLVEDHGVTAKMMKMVLTAEGHSVETAGDVATALEQASQNRFDLLMSDLGLPDGSGHDLLRELRVRGYNLPAIALSGYGQESDIRRSYEAGFAAHLTKPASRESVIEAVASIVAAKKGNG